MSIQNEVEQLADSYGVADCPIDFGEEEAHIEDNKPRILLMGLRRSGKSSIQKVFLAALLAGLVCHAAEPPAAQWSGDDYKDLRTCVEKEQYLHQGLCCLNCQADEIVTAPCSTTTDARCQCASGSFCVPDQACEVCRRCARCEPGEEEVKKCTPFSNTECPKRDPSPTEKTPAPPSPTPAPSADIVTPVCTSLAILFIIIALAVWGPCEIPCLRSHCDSSDSVNIPIDESGATAEDRQNDLNAGL